MTRFNFLRPARRETLEHLAMNAAYALSEQCPGAKLMQNAGWDDADWQQLTVDFRPGFSRQAIKELVAQASARKMARFMVPSHVHVGQSTVAQSESFGVAVRVARQFRSIREKTLMTVSVIGAPA